MFKITLTKEMSNFLELIGNASYDLPTGPSYILPNGKFLHYQSNIISKTPIHPAYQILFNAKFKLIPPDEIKVKDILLELGCIRVNDGTIYSSDYYITLPKFDLTEEQYKSLALYLDYIDTKGKYSRIGISFKNDSELIYNDYTDDVDFIIKKIRCAYNAQR